MLGVAESVEVTVFDVTILDAAGIAEVAPFQVTERSWPLHHVQLAAQLPDREFRVEPYFAGVGTDGDAVSLRPSLATHVSHVSPQTYSSEEMASAGPVRHRFAVNVSQDHLQVEAQGALEYRGALEAKLLGPTLSLHADENDTVLATGDDGSVGATKVTWAVVRFHGASLTLAGPQLLKVAMADGASIEWSGAAHFAAISGFLRTEDGSTFVPNGREGDLVGHFQGALRLGHASADSLSLENLRGNLQSTTMATQMSAPESTLAPSSAPWLLGILALGMVLGAGVTLAPRWRRKPAAAPELHVDLDARLKQLRELATGAVVAERWTDADAWLRQARGLAPTSVRLKADHAFVLRKLGRFDEAFELGVEACDATPEDDEVFLETAAAAAMAGRTKDAAHYLKRAVALYPENEDFAQEELALQDVLESEWYLD